jgi:hypothetical protein
MLTCENKKVLEFYDQHQNLDFESMNLLFVNILEELNKDITSSLSNNIASQLLTNIKNLQGQVDKLNTDTQTNFKNKFTEFKKEYIEDMKMILSNNNSEKIAPLIKEYNGSLLDKTQLLLNEVVPKNNELLLSQVKENIKSFHSSIHEDTNKLLSSTLNQQSLEGFIQTMENKLSNNQQIIQSIIQSSEQRLDSKMTSNQHIQTTLQTNVSDLLKKMENSSMKGKYSENILFSILQSLYSTAEIDVVGEQKETGDIMFKRKNKPTILIENKNWSKNVVQEEVKKFIRDVETQNCCGLFLSQNFGIANKDNFEINVHNGNILLYVHEVNNDAEKIKIAIDIIDNFKMKLDECSSSHDGYTIDKEILDDINKEYQLFATQKMLQIKTVKDFSTKMVKQLEEMQLPSLEHFLSTKYAFSSSKFVCEFCDYVGKNQSAMSAHKRGCKGKKSDSDTEVEVVKPVVKKTKKSENKL